MDVKLENLIEKIKKEGIEQARQKSEEIIKEAQAQAKKIIKEAKEEAAKAKERSEKEIKRFEDSSRESLKQAGRNLILSLKEKLTFIFDNILKQELKEALGPEVLTGILENLLKEWNRQKDKSFEVLVNKEDKEKLEKLLFSRFREKAEEKIEIKVSSSLRQGFQVRIKGQDSYYDFSDEAITEAMSVFLNPSLAALIAERKDG